MPCYTVTTMCSTGHRLIYKGRVRRIADERYEAAKSEPQTVVTLTKLGFPPTVIRKSDDKEAREVLVASGAFVWGEGRCPCRCAVHGVVGCGCACPRHPHATGLRRVSA